MVDVCISKETIQKLDDYILSQNILLLNRIATEYNLDKRTFIQEILPQYIDTQRCMSRVWNQGYGGQCHFKCNTTDDNRLKDYCHLHQKEILKKNELRYGRIDEISKFRLKKKLDEPYLRCNHYHLNKEGKRMQCSHRITNKDFNCCGVHIRQFLP